MHILVCLIHVGWPDFPVEKISVTVGISKLACDFRKTLKGLLGRIWETDEKVGKYGEEN